jgi:hypothetical protein
MPFREVPAMTIGICMSPTVLGSIVGLEVVIAWLNILQTTGPTLKYGPVGIFAYAYA